MITIIDYGMGNLKSVHKAFEFLGCECELTQDYKKVESCDRLVFPGVGAFGDCISNIKRLGLMDAIHTFINKGRPFLGICLGLQTLFDSSEEDGHHLGLGTVSGSVIRFEDQLTVPHMGWNRIHKQENDCPLLDGIDCGSYVYFVHSYFVVPHDTSVVATRTDYGIEFASMIWKDNVYGVQFHPEKSQRTGLKLLENYSRL